MKIDGMWDGDIGHIEPTDVVVQMDFEFHNPFTGSVLRYTKGEKVTVEHLVPASRNEPFGFPFFWGNDPRPVPVWLVEPVDG